MKGDIDKAEEARTKAGQYKQIMEEKFWDASQNRYNTFWTDEGAFKRGEGAPFVLWFDVTDNTEHIRALVKDILSQKWNVENLSAFPMFLYKYGYLDEAYRHLIALPKMNRSEYPEVSFSMVEGIVCGAMGLQPSFSKKQIATCSRLQGDARQSSIKNVPVFGGYVSVTHADKSTTIENNTDVDLTWEVSFMGEHSEIIVDGKKMTTSTELDANGNAYSRCLVPLPAHACAVAEVE